MSHRSRRLATWLSAGAALVGLAGPGGASAFAASSPSLEAEQLTYDFAHAARISDATASGGAYLGVWGDTTATGVLSAPAGGHLVVRGQSTSCHGAASASVQLDGRAVAVMSFTGAWADRAVAAAWPGGTHTVAITFQNDYRVPGCDRNLLLDDLLVRPLVHGDTVAPVQGAVPGLAKAFGVSSPGKDAGLAKSLAAGSAAQRQVDLVDFAVPWSTKQGLPVSQLRRITTALARPEITWQPWDPAKGQHQSAYTLKAIAQGRYDAYILRWAHAAAAYGQPFLLRFAPDPNSTWYPWAVGAGRQRASDYVAAYRRVHQLFVAARATNVTWVWSPYAVQGLRTSVTSVYPGDKYVDVIGVDAYNGGKGVMGAKGWRTPSQVLAPTLAALHKHWPAKPVMLSEVGSTTKGGSKPAWIRQLFAYLTHTPVTAVVWHNFATSKIDWRLNSSQSSVLAIRTALRGW